MSRQLKVAVIGAGFAGIAAAVALKRRGFDFTVFEKAPGPGGTWWYNRYPGAEVDSPSHIYSFSFSRNDWSRTHARQPELQSYMERTIREQGIGSRFRYGVQVRRLVWDEARSGYLVYTDGDVQGEFFDAVISAVGFFNEPNIPRWAAASPYTGQLFHSSRWPDALDLGGKRVGIVGTGSTSVQIVTEAAKTAASVHVFQREANWVLPKGDRDLTIRERRRLRRTIPRLRTRLSRFLETEVDRVGGRHSRQGTAANTRLAEAAAEHLRAAFAGHPELLAAMTPHHPFQGKRPVVNDTFYPTLLRENVEVVPYAVERLSERGAVDSQGAEHQLDVIVLATGFRATKYLSGLQVIGRGGVDLHEHWAGEPAAYLGIAVPGFPNFFMCYGPGTNTSPLVYLFEKQAAFAAKALATLRRRSKAASVEVDHFAADIYDAWLQHKVRSTLWATTSNYFRSASGRVVTQWPVSASFYSFLTRATRRLVLRYQEQRTATVAPAAVDDVEIQDLFEEEMSREHARRSA